MSFRRPKLARPAAESFAKLLHKATPQLSHSPLTRRSTRARTGLDSAIVRPTFTRAELINAESALGRTIFGPVPAGHQREFFELEQNVWIWHESYQENGTAKETTVRYEVRHDGVYKKLQGSTKNYVRLQGPELENFRKSLHAYLAIVKAQLY